MSDTSGTVSPELSVAATDRRRFIRDGALAALAAGTLAACRKPEAAAATTTAGMSHGGAAAPPPPSPYVSLAP
jgi:hypothetical protein